jgi:nickel transport protein
MRHLDICESSEYFYGKPLVVSCERTVRAEGGLVKSAGMVVNQRAVCRTSLFLRKTGPRRVSGRAQDTTRGGVWKSAVQNNRKPGLLMANIQMKHVSCLLVVLFVVLSASGTALAHKVNLFAYVEGGMVFTESYFSDGKPVQGGRVLVYDSKDKLLLEGATDTEGLFNFEIPKIDALKIVIDATMGHKNRFTLKKAEVEAGK